MLSLWPWIASGRRQLIFIIEDMIIPILMMMIMLMMIELTGLRGTALTPKHISC